MDRMIFYKLLTEINCDDKDRDECFGIIATLLYYNKKGRHNGLSSLGAISRSIEDHFLKTGLELIYNGSPEEYIYNILMTYICSSRSTNAVLLRRLIILEGVLSINSKQSPEDLVLRTTSLLGDNYRTGFLQYLEKKA